MEEVPGPRVDEVTAAPATPTFVALVHRIFSGYTLVTRHHALQGDPRVVHPHGQSELRIRVLVVISTKHCSRIGAAARAPSWFIASGCVTVQ